MEATVVYWGYVGGCQDYGPFLDPCFNTAPNIKGTQKGTRILTTAHISIMEKKMESALSWLFSSQFGYEVVCYPFRNRSIYCVGFRVPGFITTTGDC